MRWFLAIVIFLTAPGAAMAGDDCARATEMVKEAFDLGDIPRVRERQKALLNQALALCPDHHEAHNNLAYICETETQYDKALFHYQASVRATPGFAAGWLGLGDVFFKTDQFPLALQAWLNACQEDQDARSRIRNVLAGDRYRASEAGELMNKESLLLLFDPERREKINRKLSDCGFKASVTPEITFRNLQFDVGSARIRETSIPQLNEIAAALRQIPGVVNIGGHTDKQSFKGRTPEESVSLNLALSRDRANAAADYLAGLGVSRNRIRTQGFGPDQPVAYGDSDRDYAKNRRVVIEVTEQPYD